VKEKLARVQPRTLGQAGRIEGMTPGALTALLAYVKARAQGIGRGLMLDAERAGIPVHAPRRHGGADRRPREPFDSDLAEANAVMNLVGPGQPAGLLEPPCLGQCATA
jgi:hypothetical protein